MHLSELKQKSVDRLLAAEYFDERAFQALYDYLCLKSESIKAEPVVSKQVIECVLSAVGAIQSRAEYLPDVRPHLSWADKFLRILGLMAIGEACSDRRPGVPRII
jgi:hypothetical protein